MSAITVSWLDVSWGAVFFETNYGLMQHSYIEIKERLLKALDSEYNVVDMATVFDVVAVLERTPITEEILESTRLGRVINECRRRTNNEALARRAKLLVRKWREMMVVGSAAPQSSAAASASSSNPPTPATLSPVAPHQNGTNVRSPNMAAARLGASAISPSFSLPSSRCGDRLPRANSVSPALSASGAVAAAAGRHYGGHVNNNNNSNYNNYSSSKSGSAYIGAANLVSPSASSSSARSPLRDSKVESVPKTHVANKRLRKSAAGASATSPEPPTKVAKMNGALYAGHQHHHHHHHHHRRHDDEQPQPSSSSSSSQHYHNIHLHHHHHKQPDTERLLSPPSTFGSTAYSAVAERLGDDDAGVTSVMVTANDDADSSAAPDSEDVSYRLGELAAATVPEPEPDPPPAPTASSSSSSKKRSRKKANKKSRGDGDVVREKLQALSKTGRVKTTEELVAELKTLNDDRLAAGGSASEVAAADPAPFVVGSCAAGTAAAKPPSLSNSYASDSASSTQHRHVVGAAGAAATSSSSRVPLEQLDAEARVEREIADILARLPPLDATQIRWDETPTQSPRASPPPSSSPPPPPSEEQLERYLRGRWDGLNGCVTHGPPDAEDDDNFREWHRMVARRTVNDDLIHILPYSIVD